jgi:hypothetical protein
LPTILLPLSKALALMTARHHHFLSQCYLKGFTKGKSKKSKLAVIDVKGKKSFETTPRNVGGVRDFNRVEIEGVDPNHLESELSKFEGQAATALKKLRENLDFSGETKDVLLNFIALIAVRSPERREHMTKFHAQVAERIMGMTLDSKEMWESQTSKLKDNGDRAKKVSYEDAKEFFDSKKFTIEVAREHHINMEMVQIDAILPFLFNRKWLLVVANDETGPFITTDRPMNLSWIEPEKIPPFYRASPGFGLMGTEVYFPISQELALIGEFDGEDKTIEANEGLVAVLNSKMLFNLDYQIYAPKFDFKFFGKNSDILSGKDLLRELGA